MEQAARAEAAKHGLYLQVSAGQTDDDTYSQINEIDEAIAAGAKGIVIALNGDAVNTALQRAESYGITVVALDTPPTPPGVADVTYATDNTAAGTLIGRWVAQKLHGANADIAMLDDLSDQVLSVDVDRDHGFLHGMGIPVGNPHVNGQEPKSGKYSGGKGGSYRVSCQLATQGGQTGGQSAMERCLAGDSNINVVYAINEPAAEGAALALKSAGKKNVIVVAIDGGCSNLPYLRSGEIDATAGQFPDRMAQLGVEAVQHFASTGSRPHNQAGKDFFNTGTKLYTNDPQPGVPSVNVAKAAKLCWGAPTT
jgi:fructose transport system substrate-binding protein